MLRLPATSIAISQSEIHAELNNIDFYSSLLRQGFKKREIIRHLRKGSSVEKEESQWLSSTYELAASPVSPSEQEPAVVEHKLPLARPDEVESMSHGRNHMPRQSSLLRFASTVSSNPSEKETCDILPSSHRHSVTYRPRSETYSYDQSVADEDGCAAADATSVDGTEDSSSENGKANSAESDRLTMATQSSLRPDAEPFTPRSVRLAHSVDDLNDTQAELNDHHETQSLPSSPPSVRRASVNTPQELEYTSNPSTPRHPSLARGQMDSAINLATIRQHHLDGSFTIYNDSAPACSQPQTPADLNQRRYLDEYTTAFTAPPGMIRSSASRQGGASIRQTSGEMSPAARVAMVRERRQREFVRGLRVEGLRIDRAHSDARLWRQGNMINQLDLWRDNLNADGVGEENFEEQSVITLLRRMRIVSGNRRPT